MFFNTQGRWYILSLVVQYDRRTTKQCECSTGDRTFDLRILRSDALPLDNRGLDCQLACCLCF